MVTEPANSRLWLTSLPHEVSALFPSAPAELRYEYAICSLESAPHGGLAVTLVIRARGPDPAERFVINPVRLAEEIVATVGGGMVRIEASKPQLRAGDDTIGAFRLEDVAFRCLKAADGCQAALRVRHWAPANQSAALAAAAQAAQQAATANGGMAADGKVIRKCCECGRRGHRKQCCCDAPGNCRVEFIWSHSCEMKSTPVRDAEVEPVAKRARLCTCAELAAEIRDAGRKIGAARNALRSLRATVASLEGSRSRMPKPTDVNASILRTTLDKSLAPRSRADGRGLPGPAHVTNARAVPARAPYANGTANHS